MKHASDLYKMLGVSKNASTEDIKKAYRKLCLKYHPDRCQHADRKKATEQMMLINEANDVLSDPNKRKHYDQTGFLPGVSRGL